MKEVLKDLKSVNCDIVTIGQYFQPTKKNLDVARFVSQEEYEKYVNFGKEIGIKFVFAGTYVRSSYNAYEILKELRRTL